jgi:ergothioneine biosynthesis protein EgtB
MPACSPVKWHRAHTTWFFETFVLGPSGAAPFDERYGALFNSYYVSMGLRHARDKRALLSRPSAGEIDEYRRVVDDRMLERISRAADQEIATLAPLIDLGLAHEEQHQELMLTDVLSAFAENPIGPVYGVGPRAHVRHGPTAPLRFIPYDGGLRAIGADDGDGFSFDNEQPRHRVWVEPFALADRLLTFGEWKAFADAGGYDEPLLWLSEGFEWARANGVRGPLYLRQREPKIVVFGLHGEIEASDDEPVVHLSFYEADALARFFGARLPTEAEWEIAAGQAPVEGNFLDTGALRAQATPHATGAGPVQLFGDAWEWTQSPYAPYPGFKSLRGPIGEYNGKFMVNQMVLRGGSSFTPAGHVRATYRNFWHPDTRFQLTGVRLARSAGG